MAMGRLLFNKDLTEYHDCMRRNIEVLHRARPDMQIEMITTQGMAVDSARNMVVHHAIEKQCEAVIWIDTDLIIPNDGLLRLVMMWEAGHDIACGLYRRSRPPFNVIAVLEGELTGDNYATIEQLRERESGGVTRCSVLAGGFSIVSTEVYLKVLNGIGMPWYCNWDFVSGKGNVGEDRFFLLRAAEVGVTPVCDPELHSIHWASFGPVPVVEDQPEMAYVPVM